MIRDLHYANQHDAIYASLDRIDNWFIYGHLSLNKRFQADERVRLDRFHLLVRDAGRRFAGCRDLNKIAWFLREEGNGEAKRFHFHFAFTSDNLGNTTAETVCRYLRKQWGKIAQSVCEIEPWAAEKTARGIWYLTENEPYEVPHCRYFNGDYCRWKMSTLLHNRIKGKTQETIIL